MCDLPTLTDFESLSDRRFVLESPPVGLVLELLSVTPLRESSTQLGSHSTRKPFSLVFCAKTTNYLPQGTYSIAHAHLGQLALFLVPVGRQPDGILLEAVFA
jgi:hypothetical protein